MPQSLSKTDEAAIDHIFGKEGYTYYLGHEDGSLLETSNESARRTAHGYLSRVRDLEEIIQETEKRLLEVTQALSSNDREGADRHLFHARAWLRLSKVIKERL
jgi:hypothetical protein